MFIRCLFSSDRVRGARFVHGRRQPLTWLTAGCKRARQPSVDRAALLRFSQCVESTVTARSARYCHSLNHCRLSSDRVCGLCCRQNVLPTLCSVETSNSNSKPKERRGEHKFLIFQCTPNANTISSSQTTQYTLNIASSACSTTHHSHEARKHSRTEPFARRPVSGG